MKIAQHFRAFLEINNYLQLPQIGKFEVLGENPADVSHGQLKKWVHFSPESSLEKDPSLIDFIARRMKVEICIAESDLRCFIVTIKEMLIQGFEVEIPGIGYLHYEPGNKLKYSGKNIYKNPKQKSLKRRTVAMSANFWF